MMKVLVVGSGGREHAICASIKKSPRVERIFCAPGNGGIAAIAECIPLSPMDFDGLVTFAKKEGVDLTVVGMDDPLCGGIVDAFSSAGLRVFGPRKNAALLEGSKVFSKGLMKKYDIPTADYRTFEDPEEAVAYLRSVSYPRVLKADGLALGKGVLIAESFEEAKEGIHTLMRSGKFCEAGNRVVIEEFMEGPEVSILTFTDGRTIKAMPSAQDHKRIFDGNRGPNTGGMGTFSPSPFYTREIHAYCQEHIYEKTIRAMAAEGRPFCGIIFFGLMLTGDGVKVLEYNARFGDPEAQVILPGLETDITEIFDACIDGRLEGQKLHFAKEAHVCVVLASGGYPGDYEKGKRIFGLENFKDKKDCYCFHAGTALSGDGEIVTAGGRVLGITASGKDVSEAREKAYEACKLVDFEGKYLRSDIGKSAEDMLSAKKAN